MWAQQHGFGPAGPPTEGPMPGMTPPTGVKTAGLPQVSPVSVLIPDLTVEVPDDRMCESPMDGEETPVTPADAILPAAPAECPPTPVRAGAKAPGRTRGLQRLDSLQDTKLLVNTGLRRSASTKAGGQFLFSEHFDFIRPVGRSATAEVFVARNRFDGSLSAVKRQTRSFHGRADRERCVHEVQSAAALPVHPHVVQYYRGWQQEAHFYVQMELCEGGSLRGAMGRLPPGARLPERDVWRLCAEVASGLHHLHAHGVLHLDVKPDNIFLDSGARFKVGDLGLAVVSGQWSAEEGDGAYVAPEFLADEGAASAACDVFSFGATLYECVARERAPRGGGEEVRLPSGWHPDLVHLIRAMMARRPEHRPQLPHVLQIAARHEGGALATGAC